MRDQDKIKIAVAQYEIEQLTSWQAYEDKMVRLVEQAKDTDANLLMLSEHAGLEIVSWNPTDLAHQFASIQTNLPKYKQIDAQDQ